MGGQAQSQQPVFYDAEMGQYYTQAPQTNTLFRGQPNGLNMLGALFGGNDGGRTYLNNFGRKSMVTEQAPYQYADVSLESLFPQMATDGSQQSALSGLLGSAPSATGQASSGAGRFM